jgi:hypothetical protein
MPHFIVNVLPVFLYLYLTCKVILWVLIILHHVNLCEHIKTHKKWISMVLHRFIFNIRLSLHATLTVILLKIV